jgi:hypothetical protein
METQIITYMSLYPKLSLTNSVTSTKNVGKNGLFWGFNLMAKAAWWRYAASFFRHQTRYRHHGLKRELTWIECPSSNSRPRHGFLLFAGLDESEAIFPCSSRYIEVDEDFWAFPAALFSEVRDERRSQSQYMTPGRGVYRRISVDLRLIPYSLPTTNFPINNIKVYYSYVILTSTRNWSLSKIKMYCLDFIFAFLNIITWIVKKEE